MRIVFLTYKYPPVHMSGLELGSRYMARELKRRGHDVVVVVTRADRGQSWFMNDNGVPVYRIPVINVPVVRSLWEITAAFFMLIQLRPRIVHGQALFPCGWLAGLWGRMSRASSVMYLYGRDVVHPSRLLREFFGGQAYRWCDRVLAATHDCRRNIPGDVAVDVFHSGFEPPQRWPDQVGFRDIDIVFVGRMDGVKRVDVLLEAVSRMAVPANVTLVGTGPLKDDLQRLVGKLDLDGRVTWAGRVENHEVYAILSRSRVLVLPSDEEPFGVVLLEALACGCRVVGSDVGGIPEIITGRDRGVLVDSGDPAKLAEALETALEDGPVAPEVAAQVRREYGWPARVDELEGHYATLA